MIIKKILGTLGLKLAGWRLDNTVDIGPIRNCVVIAAPHTSNWDFYFAITSFWKMGKPIKVFIKDSWTKPFYGFIIKWFGGVGVDRSQRQNLTDYGAELLRTQKDLYFVHTPEGTRSYSEKWKKGFYYMAQKADVPILLSYGDYKNKVAGIGKVVSVKGRELNDVFAEIEDFYKDIQGCYPEKYNPKIY